MKRSLDLLRNTDEIKFQSKHQNNRERERKVAHKVVIICWVATGLKLQITCKSKKISGSDEGLHKLLIRLFVENLESIGESDVCIRARECVSALCSSVQH